MGVLQDVVRLAGHLLSLPNTTSAAFDDLKINQGVILSNLTGDIPSYHRLADLEFKVFSQFGDDGIIQYLTRNLPCDCRTFIEFGVGDYSESNTRFLLQKDNWSGFVLDGSVADIARLRSSSFFWRHDLEAKALFITKENIREALQPTAVRWGGLDLLHIDLDGNDYWIWKELDLLPGILVLEYNSTFGCERAVTVPYSDAFERSRAHFSNLYWGSSLKALHGLSATRGYAFIGCNSAGNNAYFVRRDLMNHRVREVSLKEGFVKSKFRESRDESHNLTYLDGDRRFETIRGMPVFNVESGSIEAL